MEQMEEKNKKLRKIKKKIKDENTNYELLFGRSDNYKLFKTIFEKDEIQDFKNIVLDTLDLKLKDSCIEDYEIDISKDGSIESLEVRIC